MDAALRRRRRCFHRVISGLERGGQLRLLTLTSSNDSDYNITRSWRRLIMRLRRRNLVQDYIKVTEFTKGGLPHIHLIYRGKYIDQAWISKLWLEIHKAKIVDIRLIRHNAHQRRSAAHYLAKYAAKEKYTRYSWSRCWVYPRFVKVWRIALSLFRQLQSAIYKHISFKVFLDLWHDHLRQGSHPANFLALLQDYLAYATGTRSFTTITI